METIITLAISLASISFIVVISSWLVRFEGTKTQAYREQEAERRRKWLNHQRFHF
jgi:hypothetical protein